MQLYDYPRSSACFRVRIALNLKKLPYDILPIHLLNEGGEHHSPLYRAINPQGLVPTLVTKEEALNQSLAIIEYLDDCYPTPPLLPAEPLLKAKARALAYMIAADIHPLNNLRVLERLRHQFAADEEAIRQWYHHWLHEGFNAIEKTLQTLSRTEKVCIGSTPTVADLCLIPQVYNAKRYAFNLEPYPLIRAIEAHCMTLKAFQDAAPVL